MKVWTIIIYRDGWNDQYDVGIYSRIPTEKEFRKEVTVWLSDEIIKMTFSESSHDLTLEWEVENDYGWASVNKKGTEVKDLDNK